MPGKIIAGSNLPNVVHRKRSAIFRVKLLGSLSLILVLSMAVSLIVWHPSLPGKIKHLLPAAGIGVPSAVVPSPSATVPDTPKSPIAKTKIGLFQKEIGPIPCPNKAEPKLSITISLQLNYNDRALLAELNQKEDYLKVLTQMAISSSSLEAVEIPVLRDTLLHRFNTLLKTGHLQDVGFTQFFVGEQNHSPQRP
jgi:flagellar basal body-associated protein FliL